MREGILYGDRKVNNVLQADAQSSFVLCPFPLRDTIKEGRGGGGGGKKTFCGARKRD